VNSSITTRILTPRCSAFILCHRIIIIRRFHQSTNLRN